MILNATRISASRLLLFVAFLALASLTLAICIGSGKTGVQDLISLLQGEADPTARDVLLRLRLPRALAAFGTGASLALELGAGESAASAANSGSASARRRRVASELIGGDSTSKSMEGAEG